MPKRVVIHGHFYQPPRENPWTGLVEKQPSAAPDHDWNQRIARECYLPNVALGNLQQMSFNFGPTLLTWADAEHPEVSNAVAAADAAAIVKTGHGAAMAQLFSHPIAPLLSERDRRTQVRWGVADFERRYGRRPRGMWLPECAVDTDSLRSLVEEGIEFTVLSAPQAKRFCDDGQTWHTPNHDGIATDRPARVDLGGGKSIVVFFYNRQVSQEISFGDTLAKPEYLLDAIRAAAAHAGEGGLVLAATDGETFGHHKKAGAETLAGAFAQLKDDKELLLSTLEAALAPAPARLVEIHERSAWSCAHGLGRWTENCGCRHSHTQQNWRAPLREAVEMLTSKIHAIFETQGSAVFHDPWRARDQSAGAAPQQIHVQTWYRDALRDAADAQQFLDGLRLLEMERQLLFAHTSCGWFFDDIGGLEPVQNLRCAKRAIELSRAPDLETQLIEILRKAPSNDRKLRNGAIVYQKIGLPGLDLVSPA